MTGPAHNVALALWQDASLNENIEIIWLGGWMGSDLNSARLGYNAGNNPSFSADIYESGVDVTVVNSQSTLDWGFVVSSGALLDLKEAVVKRKNALGNTIMDDWNNWNEFFSIKQNMPKQLGDPLIAYFAVHPEAVSSTERYAIDVIKKEGFDEKGFMSKQFPIIKIEKNEYYGVNVVQSLEDISEIKAAMSASILKTFEIDSTITFFE